MNFLKVLWSDISAILKNRFIRVSVIAITLIPLIYGGLYLAAFWDPYGNTSKLPVAIVNLDKGGISDDKNVNYGKDMVDNLKYNHDLAWNFVNSEQEAEKGLKGDKYYAMIIVPKDFTQKLVDVNNGKVKKPELIYVSNKKKNYVVGLISDKASKALQNEVSSSVAGNFSESVFDSMYELRDGMVAASDATNQVRDGVQTLRDKIPALSDGVGKLYDGSSSLNSKLLDASNGANTLRDGAATLKDKMPDLIDGVNKLDTGATSLNKHINDALKGSNDLRAGAATLTDKIPTLSDGVKDLYDGSTQLKDGLNEMNSNMPELVSGVSDLRNGGVQIEVGLNNAMIGSAALSSGIGQLQAGAQEMEDKIADSIKAQLTPQLPTLLGASGVGGLYAGMAQIDALIPAAAPFKATYEKDLAAISTFKVALSNLSTAIAGNDSATINASLISLGTILNGGSLETVSSDLASISALPGLDPTLKGGIDQIKAGVDLLITKVSSLKSSLALLQGEDQLATGAEQLKTSGADALTNAIGALYKGSVGLALGIEKLNDKTGDLANGVDTLYSGSKIMNNGVSKFKTSIPDLKDGVTQLADGSRDLSDGLYKLNSGAGSLTDGVDKLKNKIPDLQDGVNQLSDGTVDLSNGVLKLYNGSGELKDGIQTLNNKIPDLQDGTNKLFEGTAQLNDSLKEGASKVSDKLKVPSKEMSSFMTSPVKLNEQPLYKVDTYGYGLAPYFLSLGLWVGALMMFFVITEEIEGDLEAGPVSLVLGKYLTYSALGVIQAILISVAVLKLGLKPPNLPLYFGFNIFLSLVFIAIMQNLVFLLGMVGRLLAIIALVLQLTSSYGTFPKELLPGFFRAIGPYLPFTYSISAIREIASGPDYNIVKKDVIILAITLVFFLTSSILLKGHSDKLKKKIKLKNEAVEQPQQVLNA